MPSVVYRVPPESGAPEWWSTDPYAYPGDVQLVFDPSDAGELDIYKAIPRIVCLQKTSGSHNPATPVTYAVVVDNSTLTSGNVVFGSEIIISSDLLNQMVDKTVNVRITFEFPYQGGWSSGVNVVGSFKFSYQVPTVEKLIVYNNRWETVPGNQYFPRQGYLTLRKVRGFADLNVDYQPSFIQSIKFYVGNRELATITFNYTNPAYSYSSYMSYEAYMYNRYGSITYSMGPLMSQVAKTMVSFNSSDPKFQGQVLFWGGRGYYYDIHLYYELDSHTAVGTAYAVITNTIGNYCSVSNDGGKFLTVVPTEPVIDRLGVSQATGGTQTILGNLIAGAEVGRVEYTTDRRVPIMHLPFDKGLYDDDGRYPLKGSNGVPITPGLGGKGSAYIAGYSNQLEYDNDGVSLMDGTLDCWVNGEGLIFGVNGVTPADANGTQYGAGSVQVLAKGTSAMVSVKDTFGSYTEIIGARPAGWSHIRATWELNKVDKSRVKLYVNGSLVGDSGYRTIALGLGPTRSLSTSTSGNFSDMSPIYIGGAGYYTSLGVVYGNLYLQDLRILDTIGMDSPWQTSGVSGWQTAGVFLEPKGGVFKITPSVPLSGQVGLVKIRGVDVVGNKQPSTFFNTSACRPVLIRGQYSGVLVDGSDHVYRFRIVDSQGVFTDYLFPYNPSSFSHDKDDKYSEALSINGRRLVSSAPNPAGSYTMRWDRISKEFLDELVARSESGNSFFLLDHNDNAYFGKLAVQSAEEIVATVPSRYQAAFKFIGQGGAYDYKLG